MRDKIIFLDIDGVLVKEGDAKFYVERRVDVDLAKKLKVLLDVTEAKIVVSSSWRIGVTLDELKEILSNAGIPEESVISMTSLLDTTRGDEITRWLDDNDDKWESYVILEDENFDMREHDDHIVLTEPDIGLTVTDVDAAIIKLNWG